MFKFTTPKLIQIYKVQKGKAWFICSCGRLASLDIKNYTKHTRCKRCEEVNKDLVLTGVNGEIIGSDLVEMFDKFYLNGLLDYVEESVFGQ